MNDNTMMIKKARQIIEEISLTKCKLGRMTTFLYEIKTIQLES